MSPKMLQKENIRPPSGATAPAIWRTRLLMVLTAGLIVAAVPVVLAAKPANTIAKIAAAEEGDVTVVRVFTTSRPSFSVFKLERPPRLTVDLKGCQLQGEPQLLDVGSYVVGQVATTQFKGIARVMINFQRPSQYNVRAQGNTLLITVRPSTPRPAQAQRASALSNAQAELAALQQDAARRAQAARQAKGPEREQLESAAELAQLKASKKEAEVARLAAEAEQAQVRQQREQAAQAKSAQGTKMKADRPAKQPAGRITDIRYQDHEDRAEVIISFEGEISHRLQRQGRQPVLELSGTKLPRLLQRTLDASEFSGPVRRVTSVSAADQPTTALVQVETRSAGAEQQVRRQGQTLVWSFAKGSTLAQQRRSAAEEDGEGELTYKSARVAGARTRPGRAAGRRAKRYSGRRIDLDFKDADIHNILRLLSDVGSVNIITADEVKGQVTVRMRDVPWDQALDVILRAKGLGQVREGNLIRVAPLSDLEKEREAEIARLQQLTALKPLETRLIPLSYAQASKVLDKLRYTLSPRGKLTFDERTNMVIARDISGNLDLMERLIRNLDTQTPQVLIEARIVEARSNYSKELGIQWGGNFVSSNATGNSTGLVFPNQIGIGGGGTDQQTPSAGILLGQGANPNFAVNLPASVGTGTGGALGLTLGSVSGSVNINLRLSAAESMGDIRIVSAPKITTLDNVEAKIEQGVTIPFSQVSAAGVQTTFRDAKLNLTVKPHVTADGSVIMAVEVTRNEVDFVNTGARGDPTILKKEAKTEMLVKDGDTAVIGGIYTTRAGQSWQKVPWFAEIPILGYFFRTTRQTSDREEVLVFITPRIINRAQSIGR